jgi:putative SOS response-associated peptidase YedK
MRLHGKFRLTLTGSTYHFMTRDTLREDFYPLIRHILRGEEFQPDLLRSWGISISVEPLFDYDGELEEDAMCNLYRVRTSSAEIAHLFGATISQDFEWKDAIYPRYTAPVIIAHEGERRLGPMAWGFPTEIQGATKKLTKHVTNARNLASGFWRPSVARPSRRCLVPFTEFAEPRPGKDPEGRPAQYWFRITDQPVACFAGLWRPTESGPVFAFCTTDPNPLVAPLHPKAMPVILLPDDHDRWLTGSEDDALGLQAPYPSQVMTVTEG